MATIKISDEGKELLTSLGNEIENYRNTVINSVVAIEQCGDVLKGKSYSKLISSVKEISTKQTELAAKSSLLFKDITAYIDSIIAADENVNFN